MAVRTVNNASLLSSATLRDVSAGHNCAASPSKATYSEFRNLRSRNPPAGMAGCAGYLASLRGSAQRVNGQGDKEARLREGNDRQARPLQTHKRDEQTDPICRWLQLTVSSWRPN